MNDAAGVTGDDTTGGACGEADADWGLAGARDGFERLWTPHRMVYLMGEDKPTDDDAGPQCPFCRAPGGRDEDGLIVHRGELAFVVLNLYPYNTGHLMVCPYRHVSMYTDLTAEETREVAELTQTSRCACCRRSRAATGSTSA